MENTKNDKNAGTKITEVKQALDRKPETQTKRVAIVFDGKQYNIRIPLDFAQKAHINPETDEFEFILTIPTERNELPSLSGELIDKNTT